MTETSEAQGQRRARAKAGVRKRAAPVQPRVPVPRYTVPRSLAELQTDLAAQAGRIGRGQFGIMAASLTRGDVLFAKEAGVALMPASTMKVLTAVLAFEQLGPGYQFYTEVLADREPDAFGVLQGNLYFKGSGDPSISGRFWKEGVMVPINFLATQVRNKGIRQVQGSVIGDESIFEKKLIPDGWLERYLSDAYAARVSALSISENLAWVEIAPVRGAWLNPAASGIILVNQLQTVAGRSVRLSLRGEADGIFTATGSIGIQAGSRRYALVAPDPAAYATGVLAGSLASQGVLVRGGVRLGKTPAGAVRIAAIRSPVLKDMIGVMNRESINHLAELILRQATRGKGGDGIGSAARAQGMLRQILVRAGGDSTDLWVADGSGLSTFDRITPRAMVQILGYANKASWKQDMHESLPMAGFEALMKRRMKNSPAEGNLHAKTGTTNDIVSLAGYVTAANGELIAFAFIYNGPDRWPAKAMIDVMGATLAGFSR